MGIVLSWVLQVIFNYKSKCILCIRAFNHSICNVFKYTVLKFSTKIRFQFLTVLKKFYEVLALFIHASTYFRIFSTNIGTSCIFDISTKFPKTDVVILLFSDISVKCEYNMCAYAGGSVIFLIIKWMQIELRCRRERKWNKSFSIWKYRRK